MNIETSLKAEHIELIKIFFKANNLDDVEISTYTKKMGELLYNLISIGYNDKSESAEKIVYMSLRHLGFQNMLDSYLIQCGVSPFNLSPPS